MVSAKRNLSCSAKSTLGSKPKVEMTSESELALATEVSHSSAPLDVALLVGVGLWVDALGGGGRCPM